MNTNQGPSRFAYDEVDPVAATRAGRSWWDDNAQEYLADNGDFLGSSHFVWGPEGLTEAEAQLLGPTSELAGKQILEVGAGAGQCSKWLTTQGAKVVASDFSYGMLAAGRTPSSATPAAPLIQADARHLPFSDASFDAVFTSFGAIPFVPDSELIHAEAARVLRPGGCWVFSVTHPARWMFPDDPTTHGTTIIRSYFARAPYVEYNAAGQVEYAEFHRTVGDHVRQVAGAGFQILDLVEPEWPANNTNVWGGWGPERGALLPGTLIVVCQKSLT